MDFMEVKNINIFSPLIILVVIFFYVLFAIIGTQYHLRGLSPVSLLTYLYIIYGSVIFIVGFLIARIIEKNFFKKNIKGYNCYNIFKTFIDYIQINSRFTERNVLIFVSIPLIVQLINLYLLGGIPLFSGYLKAVAYNNITVIAYCIFLIAITSLMAKFYDKKYFLLVLIGLILFAATGYRATLVGIILSVLITVFYVTGNNFKYLYILVPIIIVSGLIVGYVAAISIQWQHWSNVDPLSLVFIRAGYTLTILAKIVAVQNSSHGLLAYSVLTGFINSVDPRSSFRTVPPKISYFHHFYYIWTCYFGRWLFRIGCANVLPGISFGVITLLTNGKKRIIYQFLCYRFSINYSMG